MYQVVRVYDVVWVAKATNSSLIIKVVRDTSIVQETVHLTSIVVYNWHGLVGMINQGFSLELVCEDNILATLTICWRKIRTQVSFELFTRYDLFRIKTSLYSKSPNVSGYYFFPFKKTALTLVAICFSLTTHIRKSPAMSYNLHAQPRILKEYDIVQTITKNNRCRYISLFTCQ